MNSSQTPIPSKGVSWQLLTPLLRTVSSVFETALSVILRRFVAARETRPEQLDLFDPNSIQPVRRPRAETSATATSFNSGLSRHTPSSLARPSSSVPRKTDGHPSVS